MIYNDLCKDKRGFITCKGQGSFSMYGSCSWIKGKLHSVLDHKYLFFHTIVNSFLPHFAICMQVALYQIMNTVPLICPDKKCLLKQVLRSAKTVVRTLKDVNILRIGPKMGHVTFKILLLWQKSRLVPYPDPPDVVT